VYECIAFFQDISYEPELEKLIEEHGYESVQVLDYLKQWDCGCNEDESEEEPWGSADDVCYHNDGYIVSYNTYLDYIGLCREIKQVRRRL